MSDSQEPQAICESEDRFRLLVESIGDYAIFMLDANGIVTTWNLGAERIKGYGAGEIIGQHFSRFYLDDDVRAGVFDRDLEQAAQMGRFGLEGWRLRKDGSRFWANVSITAVRDPKDGGLIGFSEVVRDLTQRRLLEEALRASEERFRIMIDEAPIGMALVSLDGRFVRVNPAFCEVVGYEPAELTNLTFQEITHSEDVDTDLAIAGQLARGEIRRCQFEKRYIRKDGTVIDTMLSTSIFRDPAGAPLYFISQIADITARKLVEKELRDAHAFLDAIVENIPLMLFIKESASLQFVRFNRAGESLLGWSRDALVGKSDFDFWPREQAEFFVEKDRETLRSGRVLDIDDEPIQTRHRGVRILRTKKVPILDPAGNPLYLLGISQDITERRRIEKERRLLAEVSVALSASLDYEQTLATVTQLAVQSVADWCAIDVLEEHGHIRRLKVASADAANATLCTVLERMPPTRDLPHFVRSVLEGRRSFVIEHVTLQYLESYAQGPEHLRALRATGVVSLIGVPLVMRGESLGVLVFGSSSPDRVYGREDLHWAEAVADRCAVAIENSRLYRASVEATQRRDQVLGVVAHDLRNPLSTILMQTSARSQKPNEVVHRAATRMNRLIQDLLDVSLIEMGKLPIQHARLSGGELVVEAVETQKLLATSSSVELRLDVAEDVAEIWGEHDRLLQVFENLIGNAIKFTTAGGWITVGAASRDQEVVFWVADSGSGIAADSLPHVFDRFWQATRGDRRGAGLGLPITKGIVEAHGGRIWVESTLGRGSTFFFSIPRARPTADQPSEYPHS